MGFNPNGLLRAVQDAALYRRLDDVVALRCRPVAAVCSADEFADALRVFRAQVGKSPAFMVAYDASKSVALHDALGVPHLSLQELALRPDLLAWVYGRSERAKGVVLAQHGVADFVFADNPHYKDLRYQPDLMHRFGDQLEEVWSMLADVESRMTFASVIKQRIRGDHGFLRIARYPEYSHPQVKAEADDVVVDGGAFNGKTSMAFAYQAVNGKVLAFEPDPSNQKVISAMLIKCLQSTNKRKVDAARRVEMVPHALFDRETTLRFKNDKRQSSFVGEGGEAGIDVSAISLDAYLDRKEAKRVDLVSLDVEGVEGCVMEGMRNTIQKSRPKLQISIYHSKDHLFSLPLLAKSLCEDYRFFMGHHNTYSTETDLYAVPREKMR